MRGKNDFRNIGGIPNIIGKGFRNLAITNRTLMKDPERRPIWTQPQFLRSESFINQFALAEG